ncbi:MAG: DUF4864 domain-containing protein [Paracoccaceae bacterium]
MRSFILGLALAVCVTAAQADEPRNTAIEGVIQDQITALKADDFARAFTYASPNIKGIFGTPQNFGAMVAQGYPMVYRPDAVQMLELRRVAGNLWQRVLITDQTGRTHALDYMMIETPEGWQINAVQLLPPAGVGA